MTQDYRNHCPCDICCSIIDIWLRSFSHTLSRHHHMSRDLLSSCGGDLDCDSLKKVFPLVTPVTPVFFFKIRCLKKKRIGLASCRFWFILKIISRKMFFSNFIPGLILLRSFTNVDWGLGSSNSLSEFNKASLSKSNPKSTKVLILFAQYVESLNLNHWLIHLSMIN